MRSLTELLRTVELVAQHRYDGDVFISKASLRWSVQFHKKNNAPNSDGVTLVQAGEGRSLEEALEVTCKAEIDKAQKDLASAQVFMKRIRPGGRSTDK